MTGARHPTTPWHVVESAADVAALAHVEELHGSLIVRAGVGPHCALPRLRAIEGHLEIDCAADLTALELPALTRVGWQLTAFGSGLTELTLPALREIGKCLELDGNASLTRVSLPSLQSIGASLILDGNPELVELSLPILESIGIEAQLSDCPQITLESWASLRALARGLLR